MKEYRVKILDSVFDDIDSLAEFIVSISTAEHAIKYVHDWQDNCFEDDN